MPGLVSGESALRSKLRICESRITPFRSRARNRIAAGSTAPPSAWCRSFRRTGISVNSSDYIARGSGVMNSAKAVRVGVDAPEGALLVLPGDAAETGAGGVHEHQVGRIEQARIVVHQLVGRGGRVAIIQCDDAARAEGAHMQPHAGGAGAAVEEEGDRPAVLRAAFGEIGDIEHRGFCGGVVVVVVGILLAVILRRLGHVVPAFRVHHQRAGHGLVVEFFCRRWSPSRPCCAIPP